jgi:hypothetical protein
VPNLNANLDAKIKNPLAGIPKRELLAMVEEFAHEKGLVEHIPILRKGALVAQNPDHYDKISGAEKLTEEECVALRDEVLYKWRVPRILYLTIITCSIGAAVQGWDQVRFRLLNQRDSKEQYLTTIMPLDGQQWRQLVLPSGLWYWFKVRP